MTTTATHTEQDTTPKRVLFLAFELREALMKWTRPYADGL